MAGLNCSSNSRSKDHAPVRPRNPKRSAGELSASDGLFSSKNSCRERRARVFSFSNVKRWSSFFSMLAARNSLKAELQHVARQTKSLLARRKRCRALVLGGWLRFFHSHTRSFAVANRRVARGCLGWQCPDLRVTSALCADSSSHKL